MNYIPSEWKKRQNEERAEMIAWRIFAVVPIAGVGYFAVRTWQIFNQYGFHFMHL